MNSIWTDTTELPRFPALKNDIRTDVLIIGGGIAGMTAGVLLQKAGFQTEIYEKNALPGGLCTGWKREGYFIDNCIHWLTGTRPGSGLHELFSDVQ